jgi:hypothetical protein
MEPTDNQRGHQVQPLRLYDTSRYMIRPAIDPPLNRQGDDAFPDAQHVPVDPAMEPACRRRSDRTPPRHRGVDLVAAMEPGGVIRQPRKTMLGKVSPQWSSPVFSGVTVDVLDIRLSVDEAAMKPAGLLRGARRRMSSTSTACRGRNGARQLSAG